MKYWLLLNIKILLNRKWCQFHVNAAKFFCCSFICIISYNDSSLPVKCIPLDIYFGILFCLHLVQRFLIFVRVFLYVLRNKQTGFVDRAYSIDSVLFFLWLLDPYLCRLALCIWDSYIWIGKIIKEHLLFCFVYILNKKKENILKISLKVIYTEKVLLSKI